MARNQAALKAAKAAKRKAVVAAKRKLEAESNSLSGRVRVGAALAIRHCLVSDALFENGMGSIALVRGGSLDLQHVAIFLLDTYCLGVKDVMFRTLDRREVESMLEQLDATDPHSPIAATEARKLLRDMVSWSEANGFKPHKSHAAIELLFGNTALSDTDYTSRFGMEGKVTYIPGPQETPAQFRRHLETVRIRFGEEAAVQSATALVEVVLDELDDEYDDDVVLDGEVVDVTEQPLVEAARSS